MPEEAINVEIKYLREEIKSLSNSFHEFMGKQEGRFADLSNTYVRQDMLKLTMEGFETTLKSICANQEKITCHVPMLEDIKKERESLKNQAINLIGKVLFWIIASCVGLYAIIK